MVLDMNMPTRLALLGYFEDAGSEPSQKEGGCIICGGPLDYTLPLNARSLMLKNGKRSYFMVAHGNCYSRDEFDALEHDLISAIAEWEDGSA